MIVTLVLSIILFLYVLSFIFLQSPTDGDVWERIHIGLYIGLLWFAVSMLLMHLMDLYQPWLFVSLHVLVLVVGAGVVIGRKRFRDTEGRNCLSLFKCNITSVFFVLTVVISLWSYRAPSEWSLSTGMDASNYLVQAAYYSENSSIYLRDAQTLKYKSDFPSAEYRINSTTAFPAINERDREFPFPPLWKMMLAVGVVIGGIRTALYVPLVIGILTAFIFYFIFKEITGRKKYGVIAYVLLLFSPVIMQYLRISTSEIFGLFVISGSVLGYYYSKRKKLNVLTFVSGMFGAGIMLVRADGIFVYASVSVALYVLLYLQEDEADRSLVRFYGLAYLLFSIPSWYIPLWTNSAYIHHHLKIFEIPMGVVVLIQPVIFCIVVGIFNRCTAVNRLRLWVKAHGRSIAYICAAFLVFFFTVTMFLRVALPAEWSSFLVKCYPNKEYPILQPSIYDPFLTYEIYRFIGYCATLGGMIGITLICLKKLDLFYFIVLVWIIPSLLFIVDPHEVGGGIYWTCRRYIYNSLPLFVTGSVAFVWYLDRVIAKANLRRAAVAVLSLFVVGTLVWQNVRSPSYRKPQFVGVTRELIEAARQFDSSKDIVVIDGDMDKADALQLALKYYFGIEALAPYFNSIKDEQFVSFVRKNELNKNRVFVISDNHDIISRINGLLSTTYEDYELSFLTAKKLTVKCLILNDVN